MNLCRAPTGFRGAGTYETGIRRISWKMNELWNLSEEELLDCTARGKNRFNIREFRAGCKHSELSAETD